MSVTYIGHTDGYTVCVTVVVIRPIKKSSVRYESSAQRIKPLLNRAYLTDCLVRVITVCLTSAPVRKDGKAHHVGRQ